MATLETKLNYLYSIKRALARAIADKGVSVSDTDTFYSYANKIRSIVSGDASGGSGGPEIEINDLVCISYSDPGTIRLADVFDFSIDPITNVSELLDISYHVPHTFIVTEVVDFSTDSITDVAENVVISYQ